MRRSHGACTGTNCRLRYSIRVAIRTFISGVVAGALVAAAVIRFAPPMGRPVASGISPPASVASATPASICGRDTFNIVVTVPRILGEDNPLLATLQKRLDALVDGLQDRLVNRAGLRHELACPVLLVVSGAVNDAGHGRWVASVHVGLETSSRSTMVYPSWDSGPYRAVFTAPTEAEADLERVLNERVQRFLEFFGKPEDGCVALPGPR
jgi:hypothetical protein